MDRPNLYFILEQWKCILSDQINQNLGLGQLVQCFSLVMVSYFFFSIKMCGFNGGERAVTQDEMKDFRITQWGFF